MSNQNYDDKLKNREAMTKVLNAFRSSANKVAQKVVRESANNPALAVALHKQAQDHGFDYAHVPVAPVAPNKNSYGVFPVIGESGKTRYDVVNMTTQTKTAPSLYLLETAEIITKYLNRGHSFYSPEINRVLELERQYVKHYTDMMVAKRNNPDASRDAISESRFEQSKGLAITVKQTLKSINESL